MKNVTKPRNFEHLVHVHMPKKVILLARFPTRRVDLPTILVVIFHSRNYQRSRILNIYLFGGIQHFAGEKELEMQCSGFCG